MCSPLAVLSLIILRLSLFFFFFSSRRRHTRYWRDWSSDCALPIYLVLGYRVDIRRESNSWRSLCERDAEYKIGGLLIGSPGPVAGRVREEGHVKGFAA